MTTQTLKSRQNKVTAIKTVYAVHRGSIRSSPDSTRGLGRVIEIFKNRKKAEEFAKSFVKFQENGVSIGFFLNMPAIVPWREIEPKDIINTNTINGFAVRQWQASYEQISVIQFILR